MKQIKARRIRMKSDNANDKVTLGGWYSGRESYLWIGDKNENFLGSISDAKLLRFARTIVKEFSREKRKP